MSKNRIQVGERGDMWLRLARHEGNQGLTGKPRSLIEPRCMRVLRGIMRGVKAAVAVTHNDGGCGFFYILYVGGGKGSSWWIIPNVIRCCCYENRTWLAQYESHMLTKPCDAKLE